MPGPLVPGHWEFMRLVEQTHERAHLMGSYMAPGHRALLLCARALPEQCQSFCPLAPSTPVPGHLSALAQHRLRCSPSGVHYCNWMLVMLEQVLLNHAQGGDKPPSGSSRVATAPLPGPSLSSVSRPPSSCAAKALECRPKPWPSLRVV